MTDFDYDPDVYVDDEVDEEWRDGECDRCYGETVNGPLGPIQCACAIGQGADLENCLCGRESELVDAREEGLRAGLEAPL